MRTLQAQNITLPAKQDAIEMLSTDYTTPAVILMTKIPQAGESKTRLCPPLTARSAAALAECLLRDTILHVELTGIEMWLAVTPASSFDNLGAMVLKPAHILMQEGGDLGSRMNHALRTVLKNDTRSVVLIGSDLPTMPALHMTTAIEMLEEDEADVVFTPTRDGGFGLVAMRKPLPALMECVEWSTATTLRQVLARARALKLRYVLLPEWYDIDTVADLAELGRELTNNASARAQAPNTWKWVEQYADCYCHSNP